MAGGEVIGAAIGVLLLILVGYVLVGSTLTTAEVVATAQKDLIMQSEERLGTSIQISNARYVGSGLLHNLTFNITNTGSEIIGKFNNTDMFITNSQFSGSVPERYTYIGVPNTQGDVTSKKWGYTIISPDNLHPNMLDPGENMTVNIKIGSFDHSRIFIIVTTPNGISAAGNT